MPWWGLFTVFMVAGLLLLGVLWGLTVRLYNWREKRQGVKYDG